MVFSNEMVGGGALIGECSDTAPVSAGIQHAITCTGFVAARAGVYKIKSKVFIAPASNGAEHTMNLYVWSL